MTAAKAMTIELSKNELQICFRGNKTKKQGSVGWVFQTKQNLLISPTKNRLSLIGVLFALPIKQHLILKLKFR